MAKLLINGKVNYQAPEALTLNLQSAETYVLKEIVLSSNREESAAVIEEQVKPNDVYEIVTSDGVTWIVSGDELLSNYSQPSSAKRGNSWMETFELKNELALNETRGLGDVINLKKIIKWAFNKAPIAEEILKPLIAKIDSSLVPDEGLFVWNEIDSFPSKITAPGQLSTAGPILLFIHGTITNAQGTFAHLFSKDDNGDWETLKAKYNNHVYAFQHYTLSKSPLQNALELLRVLPDGINIHLVTSSRGGLIGELLTLVSIYKTQPFYLDSLRDSVKKENRTEDVKVITELIDLAKTKTISISDYYRVACPALGTTLLSTRLDNYLKVVLNLIGLIPGLSQSIIYGLIKSLLINIVKTKADTSILPGLEAMMPTSPFIIGLNTHSEELNAKLKIIAGDVDPEGFFKTIAVFLTDVFYKTDHDFIVNSFSMFGGIKRSDTFYVFHKGNNVSHFNYYQNPQTRKALYDALHNDGTSGLFALPKGIDIHQNYLSNDPSLSISRGLYTQHLQKIGNGNEIYTPFSKETILEQDKINISIKHGDLGYALYPLIVGHFKGDGIVASEKAVDGHLNHRLSQIHKAGIYPGAIETSEVFFNSDSSFKGAVIIGLGNPGELSGDSLTNAFQHGALNLALKSKYTTPDKKQIGVSTLLVGSDYAGVSIRTSIRSLIDGITKANQQIRYLNDPDIPIIKQLEIIELYQDRAIIATKFINKTVLTEYEDQIEKKEFVLLQKVGGYQKRFANDYSPEWWYRLQINAETDANNKIKSLNYLLMNNGAKVDAMDVPIQGEFLERVIESCISTSQADPSLSKLFFNMLVPNSIKEFTNDKRNILMIVDGRAADIPWEMLFNQTKDTDVPVAVKSGMIRQLKVESPYFSIVNSSDDNALVIGNPQTNDEHFPDLDGARKEGLRVAELLSAEDRFNCVSLIDKPFMDIMKGIIAQPYRIIHLAGHGDYDAQNPANSGMILSDGIRITPAEIAKLTFIPELVFINCCFLGQTKQAVVRWNELAANLGTEFIKCGVKCVVAAGWAVDDAAASAFAENFYKNMLNGYEFGEAIQLARNSIYTSHNSNNTWGAYQCYGDPFYKFKILEDQTKITREPFIDVSEMIVELENCYQQINPQSTRNNSKQIEEKIAEIEKTANGNWKDVPEIIETLANCYNELGNTNKAIEKYRSLLALESGKYKLDSLYKLSRLAMDKGVSIMTSGTATPTNKKEAHDLITLSHQITKDLLNLSNTADKHILKGGNLKREALIYDSAEIHKRIKKLTEAHNEYKTAFEMLLKSKNIHDCYSLQNWIVLEEIVIAYKQAPGTATKILSDHLAKAMLEAKNSLSQPNTFTFNSAIAELLGCDLMLGKKTAKEISTIEFTIYKKYKEGWEIDGSYTKANIILKQFDIIILLLKESPHPKKEVLASFQKLRLKLGKLFIN